MGRHGLRTLKARNNRYNDSCSEKDAVIPIALKFEKFLFQLIQWEISHIESTVVANKILQVSLIRMIWSNCDASFAIEWIWLKTIYGYLNAANFLAEFSQIQEISLWHYELKPVEILSGEWIRLKSSFKVNLWNSYEITNCT